VAASPHTSKRSARSPPETELADDRAQPDDFYVDPPSPEE
jgi:hypothetical protein